MVSVKYGYKSSKDQNKKERKKKFYSYAGYPFQIYTVMNKKGLFQKHVTDLKGEGCLEHHHLSPRGGGGGRVGACVALRFHIQPTREP